MKQIFKIESCKPVSAPATKTWTFQAGDQEILGEKAHKLYRTAVGNLLFVTLERRDIKYTTRECARDLEEPPGLSMRKG